jgi:isopenicillin N synthase-like dioxygenase
VADIALAFDAARRALDAISHPRGDDRRVDDPVAVASDGPSSPPLIDPSTDSGGWTGYHGASVAHGRYNQHREGFVFSNGEMFDATMVDCCNGGEGGGGGGGGGGVGGDESDDFCTIMDRLFRTMHDDVADGVLRAIERRLDMPESYFRQEFGPTDKSSQWHLKRYVVDGARGCDAPSTSDDIVAIESRDNERNGIGDASPHGGELQRPPVAEILLPVHTDPSLISVVILDRAGRNDGGMGLEVFHPANNSAPTTVDSGDSCRGSWREISHHGHEVAAIFVGSVLSYLTKGRIYSATRHRVVARASSSHCSGIREEVDKAKEKRLAATLFVRPNGDAIMKTLISRHLQFENDGMDNTKKKKPPTFRVWNARVAKNYVKRNSKVL